METWFINSLFFDFLELSQEDSFSNELILTSLFDPRWTLQGSWNKEAENIKVTDNRN